MSCDAHILKPSLPTPEQLQEERKKIKQQERSALVVEFAKAALSGFLTSSFNGGILAASIGGDKIKAQEAVIECINAMPSGVIEVAESIVAELENRGHV